MQVKETGFIALKGPLSRNAKLKLLKIGDKLTVKMIEKLGNKEAILNLKGNLIKANFNQSIPDKSTLNLVLEGISNGKLLFSFEKNSNSVHLLSQLQNFSLFSIDDFTEYQLLILDKMFGTGLKDIFSINLMLYEVKLKKKIKKNNNLNNIIDLLTKKGVDQQKITIFSLLFSNMPELHYTLLRLFHSITEKKRNFFLEDDDFQSLVDETLNEESLKELFNNFNESEMTDFLGYFLDTNEQISSGELYYFDNEERKRIDYIVNSNCLLFCFELTFLGKVEIIIRDKGKNNVDISIFAENNEKFKFLDQEKELLYNKLDKIYFSSININVINKQKVFEKIIAINRRLQLNSALDIRV